MRAAAAAAALTLVLSLAILGDLLADEAACVPSTRLQHQQQPRARPPLRRLRQAGGAEEEEEKVRLGSSPPSCRGKCYECSPCTAVQVPTLSAQAATLPSNYKPVGWKCQCRDRLYEP